MKAARCEAYGDPSSVVVREIPTPSTVRGQVVVDVSAAAVSPYLLLIANRYQVSAPLPFTVGSEFAGRVRTLGEGVEGFAVGDPVYGAVFSGAMAEQVLVSANNLWPIPLGLSMAEAAAFRVGY